MSTHPLRGRTFGSMPRAARLVFLVVATVVAGVGVVVATFGGGGKSPTPRALASMPAPETKASEVQIVQHPSGGKLVICGGGKLPQPIRDQFCTLAGGKQAKIVIIPTATARADNAQFQADLLKDWGSSDVGSVTLLHTRSRETADDPAFVRPLAEATGVWLGGGDQVFLTNAYLGTAVEKQLKAILARGGVIGGTSAGAAVMSGVMIAGGHTRADISQGFDFISEAVIDQHFLKRNRMERLIGVLSTHPNLVGLGIDEETALVVDVQEHHLSVIGDSYVVACVPDSQNKSVRVKFLKSGDKTDLADLKVPSTGPAPVLGLGSL